MPQSIWAAITKYDKLRSMRAARCICRGLNFGSPREDISRCHEGLFSGLRMVSSCHVLTWPKGKAAPWGWFYEDSNPINERPMLLT